MKEVKKHEIIDHGVENSQYFQGCGVSCTEYTDVATGIGNNAHDALGDALEQLAQSDWDVESIKNELSEEDDVPETSEDEEVDVYHYVSIRVK